MYLFRRCFLCLGLSILCGFRFYILDCQLVEMLLATQRLENLHSTLVKATKGDEDGTEQVGARELKSTGQEEHTCEVDAEFTLEENCLSAQNHQLSNQHVLLSVKLHGLRRILLQLLLDLLLLFLLEVDCVHADDQFKDRFPQTGSVLEVLPFIAEYLG